MTESTFFPSPRQNCVFVGHEHAEQAFLNSWNQDRVHHAWLLSGMRGIGKATLACRIARFVLSRSFCSKNASSLDLPEDNPVIGRVASDLHGDFKVLERTWDEKRKRFRGDIAVDDVRALGEHLSMTPSCGGWRVVLVDTADDMNRNSANALLKMLEEPPARTLFLVLSHCPGRLLPTIRSRCRQVPMMPLTENQCQELLELYAPSLDRESRRSLTYLGEGSIGRALDLANQGGLEYYQSLLTLLDNLGKSDIPGLYAFVEKVSRAEDSFRITADLLQWWIGRVIRSGGRREEPPEIITGENHLLRTVLSAAPLDQLVEVWEKTEALFKRAEAVNLDKKQVFVSAVSSLQSLLRPAVG